MRIMRINMRITKGAMHNIWVKKKADHRDKCFVCCRTFFRLAFLAEICYQSNT